MTTLKKSRNSRKTIKQKSSREGEYTFRGEYKVKDGAVLRYVLPDITHMVVMVGTTRLVYDSNRIAIRILNNGKFKMKMEFINTKKDLLNHWERELNLKDLKINPFRKTVRVFLREYDYNNGRVVRVVNDIPFVVHMTDKGWEKMIGVLKDIWYNETKYRMEMKNQA